MSPIAAPASAFDVREVIELTAEVMFQRMAREHIDPLHEDVNKLTQQVQRLSDATLGAAGNDPLQKQIRDLDEKCSRERARMWKRIDEVANGPEAKRNISFRERLVGAYLVVGAMGGAIALLLHIYETVKK